jgi:hypothetical protein
MHKVKKSRIYLRVVYDCFDRLGISVDCNKTKSSAVYQIKKGLRSLMEPTFFSNIAIWFLLPQSHLFSLLQHIYAYFYDQSSLFI